MISSSKFKDFEDAYRLLLKYNHANKKINDLLGHPVYFTKLDILGKKVSLMNTSDNYYPSYDSQKTILTKKNLKKFIES